MIKNQVLAAQNKLRGGYYTPPQISQSLANWAIRSSSDTVLEPSCGDGSFLTAAAGRLMTLGASQDQVAKSVVGVELFPDELSSARSALEKIGVHLNGQLMGGDFFTVKQATLQDSRFDVVLGNPPFLRYQNFPSEQRDRAFTLMREAGLRPKKLTNAWVPFLTVSAASIGDCGRLAMVIPAELLQVSYAGQTREFLAKAFRAIWIITLRELVFHGVQQEVVLLLAEKGGTGPSGIRVVQATDIAGAQHAIANLSQTRPRRINHAEEKWTKYYLSQTEIDLMRRLRESSCVPRLGHFAEVDVGIVTGNNNFFVQKPGQIRDRGLDEYAVPIIGRTYQLNGLELTIADLAENLKADYPCNLLHFPPVSIEKLSHSARTYIRHGEEEQVHKGYKCSIRDPWYTVPSVWTPDAFLFRQVHHYPKIVLNGTTATSTDTIHRVRMRPGYSSADLPVSALNSMTLAFAETMGRSYGGGVLELEPTEAEGLPFPSFTNGTPPLLEVQRLESAGNIVGALDCVDGLLLHEQMGMSWKEIKRLRGIWQKLSTRRMQRRSRPTPQPRLFDIEP